MWRCSRSRKCIYSGCSVDVNRDGFSRKILSPGSKVRSCAHSEQVVWIPRFYSKRRWWIYVCCIQTYIIKNKLEIYYWYCVHVLNTCVLADYLYPPSLFSSSISSRAANDKTIRINSHSFVATMCGYFAAPKDDGRLAASSRALYRPGNSILYTYAAVFQNTMSVSVWFKSLDLTIRLNAFHKLL